MPYGDSLVARVVPAINTVQYTSGDAVGGLNSVQVGKEGPRTGVLKSVTITDAANQKAALTIVFFSAQPAGTFTNNSAFPMSAADLALVTGKVNVAASDYETIASKAVATIELAQSVISAAADGNLYFAVLTTGTPTYTSTTDLGVNLGVIKD